MGQSKTGGNIKPPRLLTDYPLRAHNAFGFEVRARYAQAIECEAALACARVDPRLKGLPRLILGGGSNIVLTRDFDGIVWLIAQRGRRLVHEDADAWLIEAGAGERWHDFVQWTLECGWPGLENLALIPGTVGAAPVQNIGAYGLEMSERFFQLRALDMKTGKALHLNAAACRFAYRDSFFKQCESGRFVIVSVVFRLPKRWQPRCAYPEIERILAERGIVKPSPRDVFDAVVAARQSKLPDPAQAGNAGSFFKNPLLRPADFEALSGREPDLAAHPLPNGQIKLAAGQLIERCGWKGRALGRAAVHARHALVIINNGNACGADILKLAEVIQRDVYRRFGVRLEPEPTII